METGTITPTKTEATVEMGQADVAVLDAERVCRGSVRRSGRHAADRRVEARRGDTIVGAIATRWGCGCRVG
jgi:hypothetical protein